MNPVVTGVGFITPIGNDRDSVGLSLREGRHGIEPVEFLGNPDLPVKVAGTVKGFKVESPRWREWTWPSAVHIPKDVVRGLAPHGVYAFCAIEQALSHAGLKARDIAGDPSTGLYCASAGSAMLLHHNLAQMRAARGARGNPLGVVSSIAGTLNFNLGAHFRIIGTRLRLRVGLRLVEPRARLRDRRPAARPPGQGHRRRRRGAQRRLAPALRPHAGAVEPAPIPGWPRARSTSGATVSSGPAGPWLWSSRHPPAAAKRGAPPAGRGAGWGQAADGYSIAASHPEGAGLRLAMERALADARARPRGHRPRERPRHVDARR